MRWLDLRRRVTNAMSVNFCSTIGIASIYRVKSCHHLGSELLVEVLLIILIVTESQDLGHLLLVLSYLLLLDII